MSDENKELKNAVSALREATERIDEMKKENKGYSEALETQKKANEKLDELETKNQENMKKIAALEKKADELKDAQEKIKELEIKAAKMGTVSNSLEAEKKAALNTEIKSLKAFCEKGNHQDVEKKYLRSDSNEEGGFIMKDALDDMILKPITETSALRQYVRVKRVSALSLTQATRESLVTFYWVGEGVDPTKSNSTYGQPKIPVHKNVLVTDITSEALAGGEWDMQSEIMGDFAEAKGQGEGLAFVKGDGVSKPTGFETRLIAASRIDNSGSASTFDFDNLLTLPGEIKTGYNLSFAMNRKTMAFVRTLKDDAGNYAWQPGNLEAGIPNAIGGYGYIELPDMDDIGANKYPVACADWRKLYTIVDGIEAIMLRNPYKTVGKIEFSLQSFTGGDAALTEAGILLKCAV